MSKPKLKPCPFCGRELAETKQYFNNHYIPDGMWITFCNQCGAKISFCNSEEKAIKAWNRRNNAKRKKLLR